MSGSQLVREARRRAGLTQAELAQRVGTTQSAIARLERGGGKPSLERVRTIVRVCGLELHSSLAPLDDSDWSVAGTNLTLDPDARVMQHQAFLEFALAGRAALERARAGA